MHLLCVKSQEVFTELIVYVAVSLRLQVCRQLFSEPHPPRLACPAPPDPSSLLPPAANASTSTTGTALSLALLTTILAATASDKIPTAASAEVSVYLLIMGSHLG